MANDGRPLIKIEEIIPWIPPVLELFSLCLWLKISMGISISLPFWGLFRMKRRGQNENLSANRTSVCHMNKVRG